MGVTGLWRLIEPAGKPVPVETLENKVLAVDISIWLHQMVKGYQDAKGAPLPNAHLMGLFQRLCKLLYFRIKPVFVFDGGFPDLKRETIAKRQDNKTKYNSQSEKLKREIALLLGKKTAIGSLLGKQISPKKTKQVDNSDDLFKLPALPEKEEESDLSESEDEQNTSSSSVDLHTVDLESEKIKNMPLKEKYDLLIELKETRKMNSWGKLHTLPKKSDNFSDFQLQRLLKRRKLQECLEETEKEMGDGCMSLNELESLLNEEGIDTKIESLPSRRIASNNTTRYLLISNVKQALADAKQREIDATREKELNEPGTSKSIKQTTNEPCVTSEIHEITPEHDELADDLQKAIQMSLECMDESEVSASTSKTDESYTSYLTDSDYSDDENDGFEQPDLSSAKAYIKQYSDLTHKTIDNIVKQRDKRKEIKINKMVEGLAEVKTNIEDNINEMSSDEREIFDDKLANTKSNSVMNENTVKTNIVSLNEINLNSNSTEKQGKDINNTDTSLMLIENTAEQPILLESSSDDLSVLVQPNINQEKDSCESIESTSDDEFEDVEENYSDNTTKKPTIELTLNMGEKVEDDIFEDIFDFNVQKEDTLNDMTMKNVSNKNDDEKEHVFNNLKNVVSNTKDIPKKELEEAKNIIKQVPSNIKISKDDIHNKTDNQIGKETDLTKQQNISTEMNKTINVPEREAISTEKLNSIVNEIENEEEALIQEKGRLDRIGRNITQEMTKDAQELLQVFGIPYIIAPMEAEAQCAFLETVKLTDGTITDDSDIWLFGGKTVYKNFFNQKKHVLQYLSERIEKSFKLTREQLILLAMLVGSDYTTGIAGVGPVTALEILASFPFNKKKLPDCPNKQVLYQEIVTGLQEFKMWVRAGKRTDNISLKKKLRNVNVTDDFPSVRVVQAYLEPNVEKSEDKFSWGEIDITILRDYTKAKFGWSQNKLDEIIKPVLKRMVERKTQKTVHDYFKRKIETDMLDDQMSKRVKAAITKIGLDPKTVDINDDNNDDIEKNKKNKRKISKNKTNDTTKGQPKAKRSKAINEAEHIEEVVKASVSYDTENKLEITIPKTDRFQEIIPQREKDKRSLLENKMKAIEMFRKTNIDKKRKTTKRKLPVPKDKADLSESSDSD